MKRALVLLSLLPLLSACALVPGPTPDVLATQMALNTAAAATRAVAAPLASPSPTPTPMPPPTHPATTPAAWQRFESQEQGFALEYPARCIFQPMPGWGWQVVDQEEERGIAIAVFDDPSPTWRTMPLTELATTALSQLLSQNDESLDNFRFVSSHQTGEYGPPGAVVRYDSLDGDIQTEMLVIRSPTRIWSFLFAARELDGWLAATRESIVVSPRPTAPPSDTPRPVPSPTPGPTPTLVGVGQETEAGAWVFTVTGVQYHKALYYRDRSRVAMGVYCVLFLDVQNHATGTTSFGDLAWSLRTTAGEIYLDDTATGYAAWQFGGKDLPWRDLNPGQRAQIVMVYDVDHGAKGLQLYSRRLADPYVHLGDAQPPQDQ